LVLQLTGCKETIQKPATKTAAKTSGDSLPKIPQSEFPTAAKNRMALKDISDDVWTLQSFSSLTQAIEGNDQLYIASAFSIPRDGKIFSECNATGKFAAILLKKPTAVRLSAQIPTKINVADKEPFKDIFSLRYGAMVDLETAGCTPSFQWQKASNPQAVIDLLSGLDESTLVETKAKNSAAKIQAAMTQSKDKLVLHFKNEAEDIVTTTEFVYTRDAKPIQPEAKLVDPIVAPTPEPAPSEKKEGAPDEEAPATPELPYGIHD